MTVVAEYDFTNTLNDSTGANHGTAVGAPSFVESIVSSEPDGKSLSLNGVDQYVEVPDAAALRLSEQYWLTVWVKIGALPASDWVAPLAKGAGDYALFITSTVVGAAHNDPENNLHEAFATSEFKAGRTYRIDATYDGAALRVFVAGYMVKEVAVSGAVRTSTDPLYIGNEDGVPGLFNGVVDKARIRDVAGSAAEIRDEWIEESPVIFREGFEGGNSKMGTTQKVGTGASIEVVSADPTPAEGAYALQSKVTSGESQRAESIPGHVELFAGEEQFVRFRFYLTDPFPSTSWGAVIWQLRDEGNGSPILAAAIVDGVLRIEGGPVGEPEVAHTTYLETPVETNRWYDFCVRVVGSEDPEEGLVQVWLDEVQQEMLVEAGRTAIGRAYHKFGLYRNPDLTEQGIVTHDQIEVTRALPFGEEEPKEPEPLPEPAGDYSSAWEILYEALTFHCGFDLDFDLALRQHCEAWCLPLQEVYDLVREREDSPGWGIIYDADNCPVPQLPYLVQYPGVRLTPEMDEAQIRAELKEPTGWNRGQEESLRIATRRTLEPVAGEELMVIIRPRTPGPGQHYIRTLLAQTPEPDRTRAVIEANLPAWEVPGLDYDAIDGVDFGDITASFETFGDLAAAFPTFKDLAEVLPTELPEP